MTSKEKVPPCPTNGQEPSVHWAPDPISAIYSNMRGLLVRFPARRGGWTYSIIPVRGLDDEERGRIEARVREQVTSQAAAITWHPFEVDDLSDAAYAWINHG